MSSVGCRLGDDRIDKLNIANPTLKPLPHDDEIGFLSARLANAVDRVKARDLWELKFTRYASHELRAPITVLGGTAAAVLHGESSLTPPRRRPEEATERMSRLVEA